MTISLADRQGNPVPDGTSVNFVTQGGVMIPPFCTTGTVAGNSQCQVTIRTQNPRPTTGRIKILAYASGEEDFTDNNFNNVYDAGDTFNDLGNAFRDDNEDGTYNSANDGFTVPRNGSSACLLNGAPAPASVLSGRAATCDGVWGAADVRAQGVIIFSTDDLTMTKEGNSTLTQLNVSIQDLNNNSVPTGSTIAVAATDNTATGPITVPGPAPTYGTCTVTGQSHTTIPNTLSALSLGVFLKDCANGDSVKVTVTTSAIVKSYVFDVP